MEGSVSQLGVREVRERDDKRLSRRETEGRRRTEESVSHLGLKEE